MGEVRERTKWREGQRESVSGEWYDRCFIKDRLMEGDESEVLPFTDPSVILGTVNISS